MTRESVVSFLLALGVVSGSMYAFAYLGGIGSAHKAMAAPLPADAAAQKATPAAPQAPVSGPIKTALKQAEDVAQAEVPEDEDTAEPAAAKPRCRVLAHQVLEVDGALAYPLSQPLQDYYHKRKQALQDERAKLAC